MSHWCALVVTDTADWRACLSAAYSRMVYETAFRGVARFPGNANGALAPLSLLGGAGLSEVYRAGGRGLL